MSTVEFDLLCAFEVHSVNDIRAILDAGFDVRHPISYAQLGLLPQMHRSEVDVYGNIERLLRTAGRTVPPRVNVPNKYLNET